MVTDKYAAQLAARIAEHSARGCYCPTCAEDRADLSLATRDHAGQPITVEGASK